VQLAAPAAGAEAPKARAAHRIEKEGFAKHLRLHFRLTLAGKMRNVFLRPRDKKIAKTTAKTAVLATAALAMPYAGTPSPLTVVCTAATAMVQNHAFHEFRAV
jgi:hypothetical protein